MSRPLRVAIFTREFPALSETFVLDHAISLIDLGHDVTVFAQGPRADPQVHPDVTRYGLNERCHYPAIPDGKRWRRRATRRAVLSAGRKNVPVLLRCLRQYGYRQEAIPVGAKELIYWALLLAKEKPFDILHCHFGQRGGLVASLRKTGAVRGKLVTTFHGYDISRVVKTDPATYRLLFEEGDLFLTVSDYFRRRAVQLGAPEERVDVHRVGVHLEQFAFCPRTLRPGEQPRLLIVGRLIEKKGTAYALDAVAEVVKVHGPVACDVVGDGYLRGSLERQAASLGLSSSVVFHGFVGRDRVTELLRSAHILLAASVTGADGDEEGIPTVLMEAMACGLPVISSFHSGIPELVEDGVSGFLAPERDVRSLRDALLALLRMPEQWPAMGRAGRAKVETDHDLARQNRRLVEYYERLVQH